MAVDKDQVKAIASELYDVLEICFTAEDEEGNTINLVHALLEVARGLVYLAEVYKEAEGELEFEIEECH